MLKRWNNYPLSEIMHFCFTDFVFGAVSYMDSPTQLCYVCLCSLGPTPKRASVLFFSLLFLSEPGQSLIMFALAFWSFPLFLYNCPTTHFLPCSSTAEHAQKARLSIFWQLTAHLPCCFLSSLFTSFLISPVLNSLINNTRNLKRP